MPRKAKIHHEGYYYCKPDRQQLQIPLLCLDKFKVQDLPELQKYILSILETLHTSFLQSKKILWNWVKEECAAENLEV